MKKIILVALLLGQLLISAQAADLWQVYKEALACDPTFKAAETQYLADRENLPIARAALLPNLILTDQLQRQVINTSLSGSGPFFSSEAGTFYNTYHTYQLMLTQPILNYSAWAQLSTASYQVKQSAATYSAASQDLIIRTAQAYFNVLVASDNLRFTQAQKRAVAEQLRQARQQFEVGLIPITGLKEAEANYDNLVAGEIAAKNDLANAVEDLRTITARTYPILMGSTTKIPLVRPLPDDIESWVDTAEKQNYTLQAAINGAMAAEQNIKVQQGGHFPVLNGTAGYIYQHNSTGGVTGSGAIGPGEVRIGQIGLALNFPIYQGGLVNARTRQASHQYQNAVSNMEVAHRQAVQQTRDSFLGVTTGTSKIEADRETIISNLAALQATKNGYEAGTRVMVDVLNAQTTLYQSEKTYSQDRYQYLMDLLNLKQAAGTLSPADLAHINSWLTQPVNILGKIADIGNYAEDLPMTMMVVKTKTIKAKAIKTKTPKTKHVIKIKVNKNKPKPTSINKKQPAIIGKETYAIALFDTRYESHAQEFIQSHHLSAKATYIRTTNPKGEARYQVIYGHFLTINAATVAIHKLPPALRALRPWVKKLS